MNRQQRIEARNNAAILKARTLADSIRRAADNAGIPPGERENFLNWAVETLWNKRMDEKMKLRSEIETEIENLGIHLPNAMVGKEYSASFSLPGDKIKDIKADVAQESGLIVEAISPSTFLVSGTPAEKGDFPISISYATLEGLPSSTLSLPLLVNPNPRSIWNDIRSPLHISGEKLDKACEYLHVESRGEESRGKDVVAASVQGRSHAHEGRPRDDFFTARYEQKSGWYVLAVADGAGSASMSWKGSEIACSAATDFLTDALESDFTLEQTIRNFNLDSSSFRSSLSSMISKLIYNAAARAHNAINAYSQSNPVFRPRDFATTLMFAICKRFSFGWFIASFWVGDGAICIYDEKSGEVKLLGSPDEGEFSGQTRFITMREIFHDKDFVDKRIRMTLIPDFTALFLMTDGVSDPLFETESNLRNPEKWREFYNLLVSGFPEDRIEGVNLSANNPDCASRLLDWLGFWRPGNHDDRTLLILK